MVVTSSLATHVPLPRTPQRPTDPPARRSPEPATEPSGSELRAGTTARLLAEAASASSATQRRRLLDEVVLLNRGVAHAVAGHYRCRSISDDDLQQVACLALVKAAQGFDPAYGSDFLAYAVPTIRGEVKRYFRDHGWMVRPTRRIQELQACISTAEAELSASLGRSPRLSEIAAQLDVPVEDVTEALATDGCFTPMSLDRPLGPGDDSSSLEELLGADDPAQAAAEARVVLAPAISRLGERDRRILLLRFVRGWTQREIAQDIGVTQMQVSRLLGRILSDLRADIDRDGDVRET